MKITRTIIVVVLGVLLSTIVAGSARALPIPRATVTYSPQNPEQGCLIPCNVQTVSNSYSWDEGVISYDVTEEWDFEANLHPIFQPQAVGKTATWTYSSLGSYVVALRVTNSKGETEIQGVATIGLALPLSSTVVTPKLERVVNGKSDLLVSTMEFTPTNQGRWENALELQKKRKSKRSKGSKKRKTYPWKAFRIDSKQGAFGGVTTPRLRPAKLSLRKGKKKMLKQQKRGYKFRAVATYVLTNMDRTQVIYKKQLVKPIKFKKAKKRHRKRS